MRTFFSTVMGVCSLLTAQASLAEESSSAPTLVLPEDVAGYNRPVLPPQAPPKYAWGGFLSQSWVKTSQDIHLSGNSDSVLGSLKRTELGVFGTFALSQHVDFRGMISTFRDGNFEAGYPQINYGLVDIHDTDSDYGVRLGIISNSSGFYSEQLNIPAYRDFELAPQGLYRESFRHFSRGGPGAQVYYKVSDLGSWSLTGEASFFKASLKDSAELSANFIGTSDHRLSPSSTISTLSLKARDSSLGVLLRYDRNYVRAHFLPLGAEPGESRYDLIVDRFGARKYFEFGDVTLEQSFLRFSECANAVPCFTPFGDPTAFNIVYRHYLSPNINLMVGYDTYYLARGDHNGKKTEAYSQGQIPAASMFATSINASLSWKRGPFVYKAEVHHVRGQASLLATENNLLRSDLPVQHNVVILNVSYGF